MTSTPLAPVLLDTGEAVSRVSSSMLGRAPSAEEPRAVALRLGLRWTHAMDCAWHDLYRRCADCRDWMTKVRSLDGPVCPLCRAV